MGYVWYFKNIKRFPYTFHTGQESICLIDNLGTKLRKELFDRYGFLDFNVFKNFYEKGFSFVISDVLDINDELKNRRSCFRNFWCKNMW